MASASTRTPPPRSHSADPPPAGEPAVTQAPHGERGHRHAGLDGLRGLAAMSIVFFHVYLYGRGGRATQAWEQVPMRLSIGVVCFFVLSAFLLYGSFARAARGQGGAVAIGPYLKRRAARILPAYYVSLLVAYPLLRIAEPDPGVRLPDPDRLWAFAVMAQNFSLSTLLKLNPVTWTLPVELLFYALLPLLGLFALRVAGGRRGPQVAVAGVLVAIGLAWNVAVELLDLSQVWAKALPSYLPYFAFGILALLYLDARSERGDGGLSRRATAALVLAGVALIVGEGVWRSVAKDPAQLQALTFLDNMIAGVGFALLTVAVAGGAGRWAGWAGVRPVAFLGLISYGVYLWHVPVILFLQHLGIGRRGDSLVALAMAAVPVTLALGTLSWYLVERPLIARAHRRPSGQPATVPAAA